jgi:chitinase
MRRNLPGRTTQETIQDYLRILQYEQLPEYQIPWDQLTHLSIAFGRATEEVAWLMPPTSKSFCPSSAKGKRKG